MTKIHDVDDPDRRARAIARMVGSEYLSAPDLVADLERLDEVVLDDAIRLGRRLIPDVDRVLLVGSGGSGAALMTAQYLLDRLTVLPIQVVTGTDFGWRCPLALGPRTLVVFASYSGRTADVVDVVARATEAGCHTVAITAGRDSQLALACTHSLVYEGAAIYEVPIVLLLALLRSAPGDQAAADSLAAAADDLPDALRRSLATAIDEMEALVDEAGSFEHLYVTGGGPLASLAFKLAPVLMENVRIGASYFDAAEMRHGPLEFLHERTAPLLALLGTDESREVVAGVVNFWRQQGGHAMVFDAADLAPVHPLLTPILLNPRTQWFVAWSAFRRGIDDLDERIFMGKGLFSNGRWP